MSKKLVSLVIALIIFLGAGGIFALRHHLKHQRMQQFLKQLPPFEQALNELRDEPNDFEQCNVKICHLRLMLDQASRSIPDYEEARKLVDEARTLVVNYETALRAWKESEEALVALEKTRPPEGVSENSLVNSLKYKMKRIDLEAEPKIARGRIHAYRWDILAWSIGYVAAKKEYGD